MNGEKNKKRNTKKLLEQLDDIYILLEKIENKIWIVRKNLKNENTKSKEQKISC